MTHRRRTRKGFVLLAVLWMLTGAAILGALIVLSSRDAFGTAANRANLTRARWIAEGCLDRARAAVDEALGDDGITDTTWNALDRAIARAPLTQGCTLRVSPAGVTLDVNAASAEQLYRLLVTAGIAPASADSIAAAVLDWRDVDGEVRPGGAEDDAYARLALPPPRNGDVASGADLRTIRGLDVLPEIAALLGPEAGRILLPRAPIPLLATLPGITPAALAVVAQRRAMRDSILDLPRLAQALPEDARAILLANLPALTAATTSLPEAWVVTSAQTVGYPAVTAAIDLRVVRSGRRLAVLRRRSDS
jgi:type II secretory pathway component PulK